MNWYELLFYKYIKGAQGQSKLKIMMPVFKGGTEQVLPENGSTPTTAPIIADMRYPDALRTDQTFLYRESPTQESGNARLRRIKGNALGWNQLQNGISATTTSSGVTFTKTDDTKLTLSGTSTQSVTRRFNVDHAMSIVSGHKYLLRSNHANVTGIRMALYQNNWASGITTSGLADEIITATMTSNTARFCVQINSAGVVTDGVTLIPQLFDLTQMGLDITDPSEFTSLFPLPYYDYNQGTLIPFSGNGIKTVGKNLLDFYVDYGVSGSNVEITLNDGVLNVKNTSSGTYKGVRWDFYLPKGNYVFSCDAQIVSGSNTIDVFDMTHSATRLARLNENTTSGLKQIAFSVSEYIQVRIIVYCVFGTSGLGESNISNLQLEFGSTATDYEPYTESTTDLPISTYFPTGMKRAGNAYDELTESKAITRVGSVDLGTLNYAYNSANNRFQGPMPSDYKIPVSATEKENLLCAKYETNNNPLLTDAGNGITGYQGSSYIFIRDTAYTDPTAFKASLSGVYLYYELATETETPITTEDANEALSLLMGKSVSSNNAKQMIDIITKGE